MTALSPRSKVPLRAGRAWPAWPPVRMIRLFLLLLLGAVEPCAADPQEFEPAPLGADRAQQEWQRSNARRDQEHYRLRVVLPTTVVPGRPESAGAGSLPRRDQATTAQSATAFGWGRVVFLVSLLSCAGWLAWRRLSRTAPAAGETCIPRLGAGPEQALAAETPAEEQAFAQFLVSFREGPAPRPKNALSSGQPPSAPEVKPGESGVEKKPDPRKQFYAHASDQLSTLRGVLQEVRPGADDANQRRLLADLHKRLRALNEASGLAELLPIWQLGTALEGLVGQLNKPNRPLALSTFRTLAGGLDLLVELCEHGPLPVLWSERPLRILAVDDDLISRHAVALALKKAFNQPDLAVNGEAAFAQASMISYDVIFLDVLMPGMDGFELCSRIRQTLPNRVTPIVFVTSQTDFEARAKSSLSGGNDFITKPFLTFEVTVKALVLSTRCRLARQKADVPAPAPAPALCPA